MAWGSLQLAACALLFGSTFLVMKQAVALVQPLTFLALRFGFAALVLWPLARRRTRAPGELRHGALAGVALLYAQPMRFYPNIFFWLKMFLMALAGLNAMAFHSSLRSSATLGSADPSRAADIRPCTSVRIVCCPVPMLYVPVISMGAQPARTKASTTSST